MSFADEPAVERRPLAPTRRILCLTVGWGLFAALAPGALTGTGSPLAFLGVALWAFAARRPGPRAFLIEWVASGIALGSQLWWIAYVFPIALLYVWLGIGLYGASAGALLRRLSRRYRPALAVPTAWIGVETLRMVLPPPIGLSWLSLGHYASDVPWLAGSARVFGAIGLSYALAAAAGLVVELAEWRMGARPAPGWRGLALGAGPGVLAIACTLSVRAPRTFDGPRLLLVQPAFEQKRKQSAGTPSELFTEQVRLTQLGLREEEAAGRGAPDAVCWGETMLCVVLADERLREAAERGLALDPWLEVDPAELPARVADRERHEAEWIAGVLFGRIPGDGSSGARVLPAGTSLVSGAELLVAHEGRLRRTNAVALWGPDGRRAGIAAKEHLVPGGETMLGLERFAPVRSYIYAVSGYVPDFLAAEGTGVLTLEARDGRRYRFGATVCFDNAFPESYTEPLREGPLDFHLIVSNEAWYLDSCEMDQMLAFSRLSAIESGRSFVRATNAGVTCVFAPDGSELARLVVDGSDRLVRGTLAVTVPVPVRSDGEADAPRPPFVYLRPWWNALALLLPLALALLAGRLPVTNAFRLRTGERLPMVAEWLSRAPRPRPSTALDPPPDPTYTPAPPW